MARADRRGHRAHAARPGGRGAGLDPYDVGARKVLELTFRSALRLGHNDIGTEHVLLALLELEDDDGPLHSLGLEHGDVEGRVVAMLAAIRSATSSP